MKHLTLAVSEEDYFCLRHSEPESMMLHADTGLKMVPIQYYINRSARAYTKKKFIASRFAFMLCDPLKIGSWTSDLGIMSHSSLKRSSSRSQKISQVSY